MVNIEFVLNPQYLACYFIQYNKKEHIIEYAYNQYRKDIVNFQNIAFDISRDFSRIIEGRYAIKDYFFINENINTNLTEELIKYVNKIILTKEFKLLQEQTRVSIDLCKNEWERNLLHTSKYIESLGINLTGNYKIYMVHPAMRSGMYLGNNKICWSHQIYWNNYNTVYIWHELLHTYFGFSDKEHAVIELITDEHMRSLLNNDNYPPFVGHKSLEAIKLDMLDHWKNFIKIKNKNILNFINTIS